MTFSTTRSATPDGTASPVRPAAAPASPTGRAPGPEPGTGPRGPEPIDDLSRRTSAGDAGRAGPDGPDDCPVAECPVAECPVADCPDCSGGACCRACPGPAGGADDPGPGPGGTVVLDDPAELVCAVPVLLGFHPRDSLVLISMGGSTGHRLGLTLRIDLPGPAADDEERVAVAAAAVAGLMLDSPRGAAVVVLADACGAGLPHRGLVDRVADRLAAQDVQVHSAIWAASTAEDARWACYRPCGCSGTLPDPATTALAVAGVLSGRVVQPSRAGLARLLEPIGQDRLRRREAMLIELGDRADAALDGPVEAADAALRVVDEAIADAGSGDLVLDDARVVALAGALAATPVRDAAMARCLGATATAAERLWTSLVREVPDPEAAEPAALLAVSALLRGDGALANVALDRAERAWPGHRLTGILRSVTAAGMRPEEVRRLLRASLVGGPTGRIRRAGGSARTARRRRPSS
ncbi:MAG TPA: DUF4192 domain-containing protein [Pseudonocardia sp.]|nr:DUF4192 domain-containing protein [Pseudonocardia sp.]